MSIKTYPLDKVYARKFLSSPKLLKMIPQFGEIPSSNYLSMKALNEAKEMVYDKYEEMAELKDKFMFYHVNRNFFNKETAGVTLLKRKNSDSSNFIDNNNRIWTEVHTAKNMFHMPIANYAKSLIGMEKPLTRKFLSADEDLGEYEMIIGRDGRRIGADINPKEQETYNFGKTQDAMMHILLDMTPHFAEGDYVSHYTSGMVNIID